MSCPFKFNKKMISSFNREEDAINDTTLTTSAQPFMDESKCPYSKVAPREEEKLAKEENKENENDSDDDQPTGGCPMRNTGMSML
jgi:hypothetical protein